MNTNYAQLASDTVLDDKSRLLRTLVLDALEGGGRGHLASALSLIEIVRVLYDDILVHDPNNPLLPNRDRFVFDFFSSAPENTEHVNVVNGFLPVLGA